VDAFLEPYRANKGIDCAGGEKQPGPGQFCKFPLELLGPCGTGSFGYDVGKPCVLLKLNKIYGLVPDYYSDPADLPEDFPPRLSAVLSKLPPGERQQVYSTSTV
jgi:sodium/potassium-transporting ATPase subunit beta